MLYILWLNYYYCINKNRTSTMGVALNAVAVTSSFVFSRTPEGCEFLGFFRSHGFGAFVQFSLCLQSHHAATPSPDQVGVVVVLFESQILKETELRFVLLPDVGQAAHGGRLLMDQRTQPRLIFHDHERDAHLAAQGRNPHHE